jgi:hypothetical protein
LLTPVILDTCEAEIGKMFVPGQSRQKKFTRSHFNRKKLGVVAHACYPSYRRKPKLGG